MSDKVKTDYITLKAELDEVLFKLQNAELDVDQAVKLYQQGQQLITELEDYLKQKDNEIKKLKTKFS